MHCMACHMGVVTPVYDHVGASLSMIKYRADLYLPTGTMKPVPKRRGGDFELFLMTSRLQLLPPVPPQVLFVCTPEARAAAANPASSSGDGTTGPWQIKTQREEIQGAFDPHVAFSFQGKGFWGDLSRCHVYCDLTTSDADDPAAVDFGFVGLPREFLEQMEPEELKVYGTMACVRDSAIWLVCIHYAESAADDLVKVWTLNVPDGGESWQKAWWEKVEEVAVGVLWGLDGFKEAGLPQLPLECPILTPDGALCVTLAGHFHRRHFMPTVDTVCIFKVHGERGAAVACMELFTATLSVTLSSALPIFSSKGSMMVQARLLEYK